MKQEEFYIILNMYVNNGYTEVGRFSFGDKELHAKQLFEKLQGNKTIEEKVFIRADLVCEKENNQHMAIAKLGCTLNEMSHNIKIILKETFIYLNIT